MHLPTTHWAAQSQTFHFRTAQRAPSPGWWPPPTSETPHTTSVWQAWDAMESTAFPQLYCSCWKLTKRLFKLVFIASIRHKSPATQSYTRQTFHIIPGGDTLFLLMTRKKRVVLQERRQMYDQCSETGDTSAERGQASVTLGDKLPRTATAHYSWPGRTPSNDLHMTRNPVNFNGTQWQGGVCRLRDKFKARHVNYTLCLTLLCYTASCISVQVIESRGDSMPHILSAINICHLRWV